MVNICTTTMVTGCLTYTVFQMYSGYILGSSVIITCSMVVGKIHTKQVPNITA